MNHNYLQVIACVLLSFCGYSLCIAQSPGPEFLTCTDTVLRLCVQDEGVRLPDNNQVYLGEDHPDATSCSVHVTQKKRVRSTCGDTVRYEVLLFLNDTFPAITLKALTSAVVDSSGETELIFDTSLAPDSAIQQGGIPYNLDCNDHHRVEWMVVDSCGQDTSCISYLHLFDCSLPVTTNPGAPYVIQIPLGGAVHLYAKDFSEVVKDDCARDGDFLYSLDDSTYVPDYLLDPCSTDGFSIELPWTIWIADNGNDLNCDHQIDWLERNISAKHFSIVLLDNGVIDCWLDTGITLSGKVLTEFGQGVKGVEISLHLPGHFFPTFITGSDGRYVFNNISGPGEFEITAYKNDFHRNGVSTLDLLKMQKHLLGRDTLEGPYRLIAADANNSQNFSAIDLIELRKLILGIYTELPFNKSWRFVRADFVFQNPEDPWDFQEPWPIGDGETITVNGYSNQDSLDFIGIKIGDVNGTAQPNATQLLPRQSLTPLELRTVQQSYNTGDVIDIPIHITSDQSLSGFQFTMSTAGMEIITIRSGEIVLSDEHYAIFGDQFTISWFDESNVEVSAGDILFTVQVRAMVDGSLNQSLSINSDITAAELYLENEETFQPVLKVEQQDADDKLEIISCAPIPWKEETMVNFYLPDSDNVTFTLFDVSGREIVSSTQFLKNGYHQQTLKSSDFTARGMLFLEISTSGDKAFQKMIVVD